MNLIYLDHNVLSHTDDNQFADALCKTTSDLGGRLAISEIHLFEICRGSNPERYIKRLENLRPIIIKKGPITDTGSFQRSILENYHASQLIEEFKGDSLALHWGIMQAHLPILKNLGGLNDVFPDALLNQYLENMVESVNSLGEEFSASDRKEFRAVIDPMLQNAKIAIAASFQEVDFDENAKLARQLRHVISSDGGLHQSPATDVVSRVTALACDLYPLIFAEFPLNFATDVGDVQTRISTLAFLLYAIGAVPRSGRLLKGTSDKQSETLFAQILDTYHIAEAVICNVFLTFDKDAARLADVVFKHAGIKTIVFLLNKP